MGNSARNRTSILVRLLGVTGIACLIAAIAAAQPSLFEQFLEGSPIPSGASIRGGVLFAGSTHVTLTPDEGTRRTLLMLPKWHWTHPEQMRLSRDGRLLFVPSSYCSQLRSSDARSYRVHIFASADGAYRGTLWLDQEMRQRAGMPPCRYPPLLQDPGRPVAEDRSAP